MITKTHQSIQNKLKILTTEYYNDNRTINYFLHVISIIIRYLKYSYNISIKY